MSQLTLVFGNKNYSSWSLRPWFYLKNLGIDFEEKIVFLLEDDFNENIKPYFSNKKVPVLVDGEHQVWDSLAIIEYLADKYPDKQGWPADLKSRSIARSVSAEMHSSFMALRNALPMNVRKHFPDYPISDDVQEDIDRIIDVWEYCHQNSKVKGPWLLGEFSGADAMYAPIVMRFVGYDVKLTGFAAEYADFLLENEHIQDWVSAGKRETQIMQGNEV